jgi:hypothetical protein
VESSEVCTSWPGIAARSIVQRSWCTTVPLAGDAFWSAPA